MKVVINIFEATVEVPLLGSDIPQNYKKVEENSMLHGGIYCPAKTKLSNKIVILFDYFIL